jgi:hypothetical protein
MNSREIRFESRMSGNPLAVPAFEVDIPARASEVAQVRRGVRAALVRFGLDPDHADIAQLVASELTMNAVLHGAEPIRVTLSVEPDSTIIEVFDAADRLPELESGIGAPSRRGLRVVSALANDWGTIPGAAGGKTVWCTIAHAHGVNPEAPKRRAVDQPSDTPAK